MDFWSKTKALDRAGDEGVWEIYDDDLGVEFHIRSNESPTFIATREARFKQERAKYRNREIPDKVAEQIAKEVYANAILIGWRGVPTSATDPTPLPVSPENALLVLASDERVWKFVAGVASDRKRYVAAIEEEARKNSATSTSGSSSGAEVSNNSANIH